MEWIYQGMKLGQKLEKWSCDQRGNVSSNPRSSCRRNVVRESEWQNIRTTSVRHLIPEYYGQGCSIHHILIWITILASNNHENKIIDIRLSCLILFRNNAIVVLIFFHLFMFICLSVNLNLSFWTPSSFIHCVIFLNCCTICIFPALPAASPVLSYLLWACRLCSGHNS